MNRREFTKRTIMASAMVTVASAPGFSKMVSPPSRNIKKGIMWGSNGVGKTVAEKFRSAKACLLYTSRWRKSKRRCLLRFMLYV